MKISRAPVNGLFGPRVRFDSDYGVALTGKRLGTGDWERSCHLSHFEISIRKRNETSIEELAGRFGLAVIRQF